MKSTVKTMLAFVAGALCLAGCAKEEIIDGNGANLVTLTAYQESDATKAAIDGTTSTQIDWTTGDKINYFGAGSGEFMTLKDGQAGSATGKFSGTVTTSANDYVLYPYNAEATCVSGTITTTIPSAQSVPAGTFDPAAGLMVGKVNGENVQFYNAVGYIAITIPSGSSNITKMVITGNNDERISGKVTISGITAAAAPTSIAGTTRTITDDMSASGVTDGVKYVEVTPNGTTTFTASSTYYVAVAPDAALSNGIYVLLYDGSTSDPATLKLAVKKSSNSLGMARNKVKKVTLPAIANDDWKAMIALEGCYLAPFNLGASASTGNVTEAYGNYYKYGEVDCRKDNEMSAYYGLANVSGLTDAATSNWGPDWRMPTKDEWNTNLSNASVQALPKAGQYEQGDFGGGKNLNRVGELASYWSSTKNPHEEDRNWQEAYMLSIGTVDGNPLNGMQVCASWDGFSVRAVLNVAASDPTPAAGSNLLAGEFTVNDEGKKVKFTKGNLWCNTTTSPVTWAFEANQYDYPVGTDYTSDGTESGTWLGTHVGHFHWTKDVANSYTKDYTYESISNDDHFFADGSDAAHNLSVAGTEGLYVLTQSEWNYLFNTSDNENVRKGLTKKGVTVAGKTNCLIIAPDGYTGTIASSYSAAEWTTAEADGLVCLPAAGANEGSGVPVDGGSVGRYYASDFRIRYYQVGAYYFSFNSEDLSSSNADLYRAFAIRLVKTVE